MKNQTTDRPTAKTTDRDFLTMLKVGLRIELSEAEKKILEGIRQDFLKKVEAINAKSN